MNGNDLEYVIVQAGRRVDAAGSKIARFPLDNVSLVRERIEAQLLQLQPVALVSSAACGSDLLTLEVARRMRVECYVLLPLSPDQFRVSSVLDRPGNWEHLFDQAISKSHVEVLGLLAGRQSYLETNSKLLDKAQSIAGESSLVLTAMLVWDGESRGSADVTEHFLEQARIRHLPIVTVSTL